MAMHDQTSLLAPLSVFLARRGGSGDRILFRYPFADPKPNAGESLNTIPHGLFTLFTSTRSDSVTQTLCILGLIDTFKVAN